MENGPLGISQRAISRARLSSELLGQSDVMLDDGARGVKRGLLGLGEGRATIFSTPPRPMTHGTPMWKPAWPYSPPKYAEAGRMRFSSQSTARAACARTLPMPNSVEPLPSMMSMPISCVRKSVYDSSTLPGTYGCPPTDAQENGSMDESPCSPSA